VAARVVDGVRLPSALGGHPALDFCNTRAGWHVDDPIDYLLDHRFLTVWAREAGLVSAAGARATLRAGRAEPQAAEAVTDAARGLRSSLYDVLAGPRSGTAWRYVAGAASAAASVAELSAPHPVARWTLPDGVGLELPLLAVALSAAELLTSDLVTALSSCPMPDCGWLFWDPRGRRTWCSMAVCGNRAKVRRYAARHPYAARHTDTATPTPRRS
jgi:predicted RNA-binding Zn ribbon-like protein